MYLKNKVPVFYRILALFHQVDLGYFRIFLEVVFEGQGNSICTITFFTFYE